MTAPHSTRRRNTSTVLWNGHQCGRFAGSGRLQQQDRCRLDRKSARKSMPNRNVVRQRSLQRSSRVILEPRSPLSIVLFAISLFSPPLFVCPVLKPAQVRLINSYLISERGRVGVLLSCARRKWRRIPRGLRAADSEQPAYCILLITTVCGRLFCFPPRCQFVDRYWIQPR